MLNIEVVSKRDDWCCATRGSKRAADLMRQGWAGYGI